MTKRDKENIFQRQKLMFTAAEQNKIHDLTVLIAGAGGLGTHQAVELQRLGVKKIYLVDYDRVEASNLSRQILYGRGEIGAYKVEVAKKILDDYNLETEVVARCEKVTSEMEIASDVELIFDALDNFKTRYELEELARNHDLPLIHGGVSSWYGQITTIISGETKKLKDIFGFDPDREGQIPVMSPAVAVVASLQVIEGVKIILGRENTLLNKLMMIDLNDYNINIIEF